MTFKVDVKSNLARRARRAAALVALLAVGACGGGTQVETFVPNRIVAFGDENSVIEADGRKYTVHGFDGATPPALDCTIYPIWTQLFAAQWGLRFPQCPSGATVTASVIHAANGAKVADLANQITLAGAFTEKDLATVFVGANDIFDLYLQYPGVNEAALTVQAQSAATALAAQISRIVKGGAKVVFVTLPELGLTPYGLKQNAAYPGEDRAGVLTRLSAAFNARLRTGVSNPDSPSFIDGHQGVQVLGDELIRAIVNATATTSSGYVNATSGICDPAAAAAVIDCTTSTLLTATSTPVALTTNGSPSTYLWADDKHLSPAGHSSLATVAAQRTNSNPL